MMKEFARFTAVIFTILGVLVILGGVFFAFSGSGQPPKPSMPGIFPDMTGFLVLMKFIAGGAISLQGLFLAALGQGLWLLAGIHEQTARSSEALSALIRRNNQPKQ